MRRAVPAPPVAAVLLAVALGAGRLELVVQVSAELSVGPRDQEETAPTTAMMNITSSVIQSRLKYARGCSTRLATQR